MCALSRLDVAEEEEEALPMRLNLHIKTTKQAKAEEMRHRTEMRARKNDDRAARRGHEYARRRNGLPTPIQIARKTRLQGQSFPTIPTSKIKWISRVRCAPF